MSSGRAVATPRGGASSRSRPPSIDTSPYRPYVPDLLLDWPDGVRWQALDGTLVSTDVSGFTALSERLVALGREGAEELSALICACFEGMIEDCHRVGGDILKFGGDALLVWFHGPDHERRACRAAAAMRRTIRHRRTTSQGRLVRLGVSTGVHAGTHHFFLVDVGMTDVVVTGPGVTATVAAESAADTGEILVSHDTAARLPSSWLGARRDDGVALARVAGTPAWTHPIRRERRDLSPFVPSDQRELLLAGVLPEHRQVTVTFLGFGGTDAMIAAGHADEVAEHLRQVASSVASACETYGVHFLATDVNRDGGKFFLTAGAPTSFGSDEGRMLRAVRDVVDADPGIGLRAGVNRGRAFGADLGSARRRTYTTLGDTTNLAARLMARAGPGEVVVTRSTLDWAATRFEFDAIEPFHVKGKRLPISAVRLGRYLGPRTDLDQARTRLMGRASELAALRAAAERADAGTSQVVLLAGEPGIGKSRLALELLERGGVSAVVRCQPFDRLSAWSVTTPLLRTLLGIDPDAAPSAAGEVLLTWLGQHAAHLVAVSPLLAVTVGATVPPTDVADAVLPEFRRERTLSAVRELLAVGVVERTTVLVDDVDVADDASRELVELLVRDPIDAPLLVVTTAGVDEALPAPRIDLGPLAADDVLGMVDDLLGDEAVPPSTVRAVVERAAGNPLFAGELIRVLIDDPAADTPDSLEALVATRIDALDPDDRRLLRSAAVVGPTVDLRLLAEMVADDIVRERERWDRLDRFLESVGPGVVRFRFDTYHRVVYGGLSFAARRAMHGDLITVLERDGAVQSRDELALLAFHADRAGDRHRTWRYGTEAARAAADAAMFVEAARLFGMALASRHRDVRDDELITVAERAGDVYEIVGRLDDAERVLALAQRHTVDGVARARLWRKRSEVAERVGDLRRAADLLDRARRELTAVPWATALREQARLESARSVIALRQSNLEAAWSHATAALSRAELVGDWATAAHAALMVDNCVTNLRWEGIHVQRPDVAALYRRAGDPVGEAKYLSNRATDLYYDGEWARALELYRTAASMSATHGHTVSEATCLNNIAEILSDQGRLAEAATLFRDAGRSWRSVGYGIGLALLAANRGRLATRSGDHAEAQRLLEEARRAFADLGATVYACETILRAVDDDLVANVDVAHDRWPTDTQLDAEITLRLYADRLRASTLADDDAARELLASTAERAADAGLPFEEALAWHVAASRFDDEAARHRATEIFARLDVRTPPPVPHHHPSSITA